jgi:hypothetical protein
MKIRLVDADLFHVDRQKHGHTNMTKLVVDFRNLAKAPKNLHLARISSNPFL